MRNILFVFLISGLLLVAGCGGGSSSSSSDSGATSTALSSSLNPSITGQSVTFVAAEISKSGSPTGTITFMDGTTTLGTGTLDSNGQAALTTPNLAAGTHSITAIYSGDGGFSGSTSAVLAQTIATTNTSTFSSNVAPLIVDAGPVAGTMSWNVPFTTVLVCAPGTSTCVTINHVAVDTGSTGLRIPAPLLASLNLPNVNSTTPIAECIQFLDNSFFFGSVRSADVYLGGTDNTGELASSVPIHVMGDTSLPTGTSIPSTCSSVAEVGGGKEAGTEEDTIAALGANGLLGVGNYQYDCDTPGLPNGSGTFGIGNNNACASSSTPPSGGYYSCTGSSCSATLVPAGGQVRNPVASFTTTGDDNGVIVELPAVPATGQQTASGSLVFGIGTQSNNALAGSAVVLPLDTNYDDAAWLGVTTVYNGRSYPSSTSTISSFLDSGSNGIFFLDQPTSGITNCDDWYCPGSTESLTATNKSDNGNSQVTGFSVANGNGLSDSYSAFSGLTGPNTNGTPSPAIQAADGYFDWGLSFFYNRDVYVGIWGPAAPSGVPAGPFWAY